MRIVAQMFSIIAIAVGVGLLVAGGSADSVTHRDSVDQAISSALRSPRDIEFIHHLAIAFNGFGACFLALGVLGLLVPWANALIYGQKRTAAKIGSTTGETIAQRDARAAGSVGP